MAHITELDLQRLTDEARQSSRFGPDAFSQAQLTLKNAESHFQSSPPIVSIPPTITSSAPTTVSTSLADVSLGGVSLPTGPFGSVEDLVQARVPAALGLLRGGTGEALRLSGLAQKAGTEPLEQFAGLTAFDEQQALLGTAGQGAQALAIGNIPVSEIDAELQRRKQQGLLRGASALGELGGGATIAAGQELAGGQQAQIIARRLQELEPLVAASRGIRSGLSGVDEASRLRQAELQRGLGVQEANIRLGSAAPLVQSTLRSAELSGLGTIGQAERQAEQAEQLADLAGKFNTQISDFFAPPPPGPGLQRPDDQPIFRPDTFRF